MIYIFGDEAIKFWESKTTYPIEFELMSLLKVNVDTLNGNSAQTDQCFSRQTDHQKLTHNLML